MNSEAKRKCRVAPLQLDAECELFGDGIPRFVYVEVAALVGRPDLMQGRKTLTAYEGLEFLMENDFISTKNTSFEILAEVEAGDDGTEGVIVSQAGRFGGWSLYVKDGKPTYLYNFLGLETYSIMSDTALPDGKSTIRLDFAYDDMPKLGAGGTATLFINGNQVGTGRIERTQFAVFSADETANIGIDRETPVSPDYTEETSRFTGRIDRVTITLK